MAHRPPIYGLLAEFKQPEQLVAAARQAHAAGYRSMEAYTPFPVGGLAETLPQGRIELDPLYVPGTSNTFPLPLTPELLARGRERYNIFCTPCHGQIGDGSGFIPMRGFRRPPTFHSDRLRNAPVGHFFDVVTNGFGAMPDYASQIPLRDRWAIIAYIRALQLSQNVPAARLFAAERANLGQENAAK